MEISETPFFSYSSYIELKISFYPHNKCINDSSEERKKKEPNQIPTQKMRKNRKNSIELLKKILRRRKKEKKINCNSLAGRLERMIFTSKLKYFWRVVGQFWSTMLRCLTLKLCSYNLAVGEMTRLWLGKKLTHIHLGTTCWSVGSHNMYNYLIQKIFIPPNHLQAVPFLPGSFFFYQNLREG